ncbi:MAG: hypothetical protein PHW64_00710 [Sulfuricurvum sp.]|nr:hypothetical protein [Sulfuricurvum sp.]
MKYFLILPLFFSVIYGDINQKLFTLYQKGLYPQACDYGYRFFEMQKQDERFISLIGFSCLKSDQIDRLAAVASLLNQSPDARANAAYFTLLIMQKKLLMSALYDGKPIYNLKFPTSSHLLSKVFALYIHNPQNENSIKVYQDPANARQSYKLYTIEINGRKTIAVDEYYDKILTLHHVY